MADDRAHRFPNRSLVSDGFGLYIEGVFDLDLLGRQLRSSKFCTAPLAQT